jgi:hypothetical protein
MATYRPACFPRRPKNNNIFTELRYQLQLSYYRYEINTGTYVMSPGEKTAYNLILLSLIVFLFSAIYYYLPQSTISAMRRLAYYVTGTFQISVALGLKGPQVAQSILHTTGEAVASLSDKGYAIVNASSAVTP